MKKFYNKIATIMIVCMIAAITNFSIAGAKELTPQEKAAFVTRLEFEQWRDAFIASLSELDVVSTEKIYSDMDFYDMQYKFTIKYKEKQYYDEESGENTELLDEMILEEKARRGLL